MLKSLEQLQNGQMPPKSFQSAITTHRVFDLNLSKNSRLKPCHNAGITALNLERIDERYLLSGAKNGNLAIHDILNTTGKPSYTSETVCTIKSSLHYAHKFSIVNVQWYPFDTGLFITSGMDHKLKIWDTNCLRPVDSITMDQKIFGHHMSTVSTQHSLIAVALVYPHVVLVDPKSGSRCHELRAHRVSVTSVCWSPLSEYLLATGGTDSKIFLWDIRSAKGYLRTFDQHNGEAVGSQKDLKTAHDGSVRSLCFTDDGLYLFSRGTDHRLRLWDTALCRNTMINFGCLYDSPIGLPLTMDLYYDTSLPVAFVPCNNNVNIYDLFSGCKLKTLFGHFDSVSSCVFKSSTQELYSAGNDMNILLWTPDVEKELDDDTSPRSKFNCDDNELNPESNNSDNWSSDEN